LRSARKRLCPWDMLTTTLAARGGHLEVLKWALAHGCPWYENSGVDNPLWAGSWR
jgi:hypothetical protein